MKSTQDANTQRQGNDNVSGEFLTIGGERFYAIRNVDRMAPFFINVVSDDDHWLFISSTGGLTAGRVSPDTALFPYITVDRIHESTSHTGSKTVLRMNANGESSTWEPFNLEHNDRFSIERNLYKSLLGNKLCFEEINHDLQLAFRYTWTSSNRYGFVRQCELQNLGDQTSSVELLDGLQNILPAGVPRVAQTNASNLVDAYKWTELNEQTGLAVFSLYSGISDRAEPSEALTANTVFCLGLDRPVRLISSTQIDAFRAGQAVEQEIHRRGIRGAYFVNATLELLPESSRNWLLVANVEQTQSQVIELIKELADPTAAGTAIKDTVDSGSHALARIMASGDCFQVTNEENVTAHHYANVLFNNLRGGVFDDQYTVSSQDFLATVKLFNSTVYAQHENFLAGLPDTLQFPTLLSSVRNVGDAQLERLCYEYLPITFGRRHGDPSRPWNHFAIRLRDESGNNLLSYQGNWRDIFQNWEALVFSYPEFVENVIAKFVNASTMDGYNPYRITKEGIDWEIEEKDNPWSYIGYWGDHQIIYLQKFLEQSKQFHPEILVDLLRRPIFSYANVPYRIKPFAALLEDSKQTVEYDHSLATEIDKRVDKLGADGKLVLDNNGDVYLVNLLEKLLVPLLSKLSNLVVDGGIWLNTQRPEWNDANNALVGQGLSMVTLYYMRRYVHSLQQLLADDDGTVLLSSEVSSWLSETSAALQKVRPLLGACPIDNSDRYESLQELGLAASRYRETVYQNGSLSGKREQSLASVSDMLVDALAAIDHSINTNQRDDGLYNAYNLIDLQQDAISVDTLYPMLEGQVAALSAGTITSEQAADLVEALFESDVFRPDQNSFMLYPDRELPEFLAKNRVPAERVEAIPLLAQMLANADERILSRDINACYRFNAKFANVGDLNAQMDSLSSQYGDQLGAAREPLQALYESVFNHRSFTGRSGGMFGFEGLGCVYWHMVSKLLLAVQENFFTALDSGSDNKTCLRLGQLYYRVRAGIGFNKSPVEFGAFPIDPYSHTPRHAGARQPGMTGQVKEELLTRFGELGIRVVRGAVHFMPGLLRAREFLTEPRQFDYVDVDGQWQKLPVPVSGVAFSWCQVPIIYKLGEESSLIIIHDDGAEQTMPNLVLPIRESAELFKRSGQIRQLNVTFSEKLLFAK
jgi:hypothetical protein